MSFLSDTPTNNEIIRLSVDNDEISNNDKVQFLNILLINLSKKDTPIKLIQCFAIDMNFVKIKYTCFFEKLFVLFENGIVCCLNNDFLNSNDNIENNLIPINDNEKGKNNNINNININNNIKEQPKKDFLFNEKIIFKYPFNSSNVKFMDIFVHPSSNFIVVRDTENSFLIFDFTLNLYYILNNSKISVKMNMNNFELNEEVKCQIYKPYEINYFFHTKIDPNLGFKVPNTEFKIEKELRNLIIQEKFQNNAMFFFNSRVITTTIIDITGIFNLKSNLNPIIDEYQLLKNHLRGQNFDSAFKIMMLLNNFQQWLFSLFLITNKICQKPSNILLIKKSSLSQALNYLKNKTFADEEKNNVVINLRNYCFINIILRCLHERQYEYAFLIIDKLQMVNMLKLLVSHSKLTQFLGINYLACTKLEEISENEDSVINELNKIIASTNFTLSQNKLQLLIKDINELIESDSLNTNYLKEYNSLEINLPKYYEGLQMEMEGRFEEAKELYKQNGLNYDHARVDKLNKELINQISEDSILEFHDVEIENEVNNMKKMKDKSRTKKDDKKKSETISFQTREDKNGNKSKFKNDDEDLKEE